MAFALDSLSYNGVNFNDATQFIASKVRVTPVLDGAKRMTVGSDFAIAVRGILSGGTDATMQDLRTRLQKNGQTLKYDGRGFGSFTINDPAGGPKDINWGPKCGDFTYQPLGAGQACVFEWSVTTRIPTCTDSVYQNALAAGWYEVDFTINADGLTTITVNGEIEIPLTFRPAGGLADNADAYRERCFPPVPSGFQRTNKKSGLSPDRKRLVFSYADVEVPFALPDGTTKCDAKHRVRGALRQGGFKVYDATISGTIRTNPAIPKLTALTRFLMIVQSRWRSAPLVAPGPTATPSLILERVEISEDIFDLSSHFSFDYKLFTTRDLTTVIEESGLWKRITSVNSPNEPGTSFRTWRESLANNAHAARGTMGARYLNSDDSFIDLCTPDRNGNVRHSTTQVLGPTDPDNAGTNAAPAIDDSPEQLLPRMLASQGKAPPEDKSWIVYESSLSYIEDDNIAVHKPLAGTVTTNVPSVDPMDAGANQSSLKTIETLISSTVPDIVQRMSSPSIRVILSGYAERYGYPIPPPRLVKFAGKDAVQMKALIVPSIIGSMNGVPIHRTVWAILYVITSPPTELPVLQNPLYPTGQGGTSPLPPMMTGIPTPYGG